MVKNMHSKWSDACGQIIAFDRALTTEANLASDPFCCHIVRLFSQLSAMATMRLHVVATTESIFKAEEEARRPARSSRFANVTGRLSPHKRVRPHANGAARGGRPRGSPERRHPKAKVRPSDGESELERRRREWASSSNLTADNLSEVVAAASGYKQGHGKSKLKKHDKIHELVGGISKRERELLLAAPCPVFATAQRIQRSIITRLHAGGMRAPPPIISRIFQEVSNGLLFYNNATKMKEVPVPFNYVQLNSFLLNIFAVILCPVAIASFTKVMWLSVMMTVITVGSFYAVFMVANELEVCHTAGPLHFRHAARCDARCSRAQDPFGSEANDMPMIDYHEEFCASLCALITSAWLPEDQWLVASGKWVNPRNVAIACNAIAGKHKRFVVGVYRRDADERDGPKPYSSMIQKAKESAKNKSGAFSSLGWMSTSKADQVHAEQR